MKAKISNKQEFQPIVIELTIESEQELCDLWHRMNFSVEELKPITVKYLKHGTSCADSEGFWKQLDKLVNQNNLKL